MTMPASDTHRPSRLASLLERRADRAAIVELLDALSHNARIAEVLSLRGKEVARLYHAAAGAPLVAPELFVPAELEDDATVIFEGKNSLPAFTRFQKRFARMDGEIVGYNHQTMGPVTGPGFFVVRPPSDGADVPGELYFDYTVRPRRIPTGWPSYRPNEAGLSRLVYANMKDYMRLVARNVVVGAAYKLGKQQDAYFVLVRAS